MLFRSRAGEVRVVAPVSVSVSVFVLGVLLFLVSLLVLVLILILILVLLFTSAFVFAIRAPPRVLLFPIFVKRRRRHRRAGPAASAHRPGCADLVYTIPCEVMRRLYAYVREREVLLLSWCWCRCWWVLEQEFINLSLSMSEVGEKVLKEDAREREWVG